MGWTRYTSMKRGRFMELVDGICDESLFERWPQGKTPETKAEQVEARQIQAIALMQKKSPEILRKLYRSAEWQELEILVDSILENYKLRAW